MNYCTLPPTRSYRHDGHAVGEKVGLVHVMRGQQDSAPVLVLVDYLPAAEGHFAT
jgi:hypothetical protein